MRKDIRETSLFREAESLYRNLRQPGTGQISDAADVHVSPNGQQAVFAGTILDKLEGSPPTRICQIDLQSGAIRVLTFGPNVDGLPKFSPDGRHIAFLSDRQRAGDFQLYLVDSVSGAARATAVVQGWVEYLQWSPNGSRILLGVAGYGADIASGQGGVTTKRAGLIQPSWMPRIEAGDENCRWRRAWVYELASNCAHQVSPENCNVWEATWCGNESLAAVVSPGPGEGLWYSAHLQIIDTATCGSRDMFTPQHQLGCPAASPCGKHLAIVEAICSDRGYVAGGLRLIDTISRAIRPVDTHGIDITYIEWRSDQHLLLAGHRYAETVVGICDANAGNFTEVWGSRDLTTGGRYANVVGLNELGDCVLVGESFTRAPELAVIRQGKYRTLRSFDLGYSGEAEVIHAVESVSWQATDGLEIQGWLLRPRGQGPYPLVMYIHGGPVWHWRPAWLGRRGAAVLMLLKRGYAVFLPNPRGSSGRGQGFIRHVLGEIGGADTYDYLAGLDWLVERCIADPKRLGVTGGSYGGFMTAWLITQDTRFAAAVAVAPVTNQVTQHLISNIPHFVRLFLGDSYSNPDGKYFRRSPIMHAAKVATPTMHICGGLDRCTPPEEAVQFHNALLEHGVKSVLVTYPEEGHGIRKFPAAVDYAARLVEWFQEHMPAEVDVRLVQSHPD